MPSLGFGERRISTIQLLDNLSKWISQWVQDFLKERWLKRIETIKIVYDLREDSEFCKRKGDNRSAGVTLEAVSTIIEKHRP